MKKIRLKTNFDCLIEKNNECVELSKGFYLMLDEKEVIRIYPVSCEKEYYSLPYALKLNELKSSDVDIYQFKYFKEVVLKEKIVAKSYCIVTEKIKDKIYCSLSKYPHVFTILDETTNTFEIKNKLDEFDILIENNYIILKAKNINLDYLLLFNRNKKSFFEFFGEKIEYLDKKIKITKIINDYSKHALQIEYELLSENIKEINRELFYSLGEPKQAILEQSMALAFCEAIKIKNGSLARTYLTPKINAKLKDNNLYNFFGNIKKIYPHNHQLEIITEENIGYIYKIEFENNLINNIIEI